MDFEDLCVMFKPLIDSAVISSRKYTLNKISDEDARQEILLAVFMAKKGFRPERNPKIQFAAYLKTTLYNEAKAVGRRYSSHFYIKNPDETAKKKFIINNVSESSFGSIIDVLGEI